jgi:hypothetical protein
MKAMRYSFVGWCLVGTFSQYSYYFLQKVTKITIVKLLVMLYLMDLKN